MNLGIGGVFEAHLPAVRRARWWRDEEELSCVRQCQMGIACLDRCRLAKVHLQAFAHDSLTIPHGAYSDGSFGVIEGNDDAAKRLERRKSVDGCGMCNEVADGLQVLWEENIDVVKVGEE